MSESIRGMVPELEESQLRLYQDSFILCVLTLSDGATDVDVDGSVFGFSLDRDVKIDVKVGLETAFAVARWIETRALVCQRMTLTLGSSRLDRTDLRVAAVKLTDCDPDKKTCILGLDLIPASA